MYEVDIDFHFQGNVNTAKKKFLQLTGTTIPKLAGEK